MKLRKLITALITSVTLATAGMMAVSFTHPDTASAFNVGLKKGIPRRFKHSWIGKVTNLTHGTSKNFIVRNGKTYRFVISYWDEYGNNETDKGKYFNLKLKYSLKIDKKQYLLATKSNATKYLLLVKFTGKKKMKYSFAEVSKSGKLYRISYNFSMKAATKHATNKAINRDFRVIEDDDAGN